MILERIAAGRLVAGDHLEVEPGRLRTIDEVEIDAAADAVTAIFADGRTRSFSVGTLVRVNAAVHRDLIDGNTGTDPQPPNSPEDPATRPRKVRGLARAADPEPPT